MKWLMLMLLICGLPAVGCVGEATPPVAAQGVKADDLESTLNKIAETGEYRGVLTELTVGLEEAGKMEEAGLAQQFRQLGDKEAVKQHARMISDRLRASE